MLWAEKHTITKEGDVMRTGEQERMKRRVIILANTYASQKASTPEGVDALIQLASLLAELDSDTLVEVLEVLART